jgi:hypothetical protein
MRISTLALAGAFMLVATAASADDPMSNTYANTVTTKGATGAGKLLFNADGTYDASTTTADGKPFAYKGTWALKDNGATICLTPQLPPDTPGAGPSCSPLMKHAVGETWSVTNDKGETFEVSLVAGR